MYHYYYLPLLLPHKLPHLTRTLLVSPTPLMSQCPPPPAPSFIEDYGMNAPNISDLSHADARTPEITVNSIITFSLYKPLVYAVDRATTIIPYTSSTNTFIWQTKRHTFSVPPYAYHPVSNPPLLIHQSFISGPTLPLLVTCHNSVRHLHRGPFICPHPLRLPPFSETNSWSTANVVSVSSSISRIQSTSLETAFIFLTLPPWTRSK